MSGRVRSWFRSIFRQKQFEAEMQEEMAAHLDQSVERLVARGMSEEEARRTALREFGNVPYLQEEARDARGARWFESLVADTRFAFRTFRRTPLANGAIVLILALGLGVNTALFTVVHSVMTLPAPGIPKDDALVRIRPYANYGTGPSLGGNNPRWMSYLEIRDYAGRSDLFAAVAGWESSSAMIEIGSEEPGEWPASIEYVTGNYFTVLGVTPALGRGFSEGGDDDLRSPDLSVVIDHAMWDRVFGMSPDILGRSMRVNGFAVEIVGVAPSRFMGVDGGLITNIPRLWIPLSARPLIAGSGNAFAASYDSTSFRGVARLLPGVTPEEAASAGSPVAERAFQRKEGPAGTPGLEIVALTASNADAEDPSANPVEYLPITVLNLLILAIICTNVGLLLTGSAVDRKREIVVRLASGASRLRIVHQLLTESVLRTWAGGLLSVFIILALIPLSYRYAPEDPVAVTWEVVTFTFVFALGVGILLGLLPALHATRVSIAEDLKASSGALVSRQSKLLRAFIVAQVTLSQPLLVGLVATAIVAASTLPPAADSEINEHVLVMNLENRIANYAEGSQWVEEVRARLVETPGVVAVARQSRARYAVSLTVHPSDRINGISPDTTFQVILQPPHPGFLEAVNMRVSVGRDFNPEEWTEGTDFNSMLLTEESALALWGEENPIGKRLIETSSFNGTSREITIVGLVDVSEAAEEILSSNALMAFAPVDWSADDQLYVRTAQPGAPLAASIGEIVREEAPQLSVGRIQTIAEIVDQNRRENFLLIGGFIAAGGLGLLLSAIGLYAVTSTAVRHRSGEIGLRMTLGATPERIRRIFLREALRLSLLGLVLGLPASLLLLKAADSNLTEMPGIVPLAGLITATSLIAVTLLASWIPARRAAAVDPMTALRVE